MLLETIALKIADHIAKKGFDKFFGKHVKQFELHLALNNALQSALDLLNEQDLNPTGEGTLDISFLQKETVLDEIWGKLLNPAVEAEIDLDLLFQAHQEIYENPELFTDAQKQLQRAAIHFFMDLLYDQLWANNIFSPTLNAKILRQWDNHLSREKRTLIIIKYLDRECQLIRNDRLQPMGEATPYIEPLLRTYAQNVNVSRNEFRQNDPFDPDNVTDSRQKEYDLNDLLTLDQKTVIIADSGLGKTTLLQELFLRLAAAWEPENQVPFLFSPTASQHLNEADYKNVLRNRLSDSGIPLREPQLQKLVADIVNQKKILYLIDALDQMTDPAPVVEFMSRSACLSICTTRPATFDLRLAQDRSLLHLELLPFTRKGIETYYGPLLETSQLSNFQDDLLGIPMIARMIVELLSDDPNGLKNIQTRAQLYRKFMRRLLARSEDAARLERTSCRPDDMLDLMKTIAFESLKKNHLGQIPRTLLKQLLPNRNDADLLLRLQLFHEIIEADETYYRFRHRSFQEYLAAEVLFDRVKSAGINALEKFLFHPYWEEPIRFLAGVLPTEMLDALLKKIMFPESWLSNSFDRIFTHSNEHFRLSSLCAGENPNNCPSKNNLIENLAKVNLTIPLLANIKCDRSIAILLTLLKHKDTVIRRIAVKVLGKIESETAINTLILALKDKDVSLSASYALRGMKSKKAKEILYASIQKKKSRFNLMSLIALSSMNSIETVEPLVPTLNDKVINWMATSSLEEFEETNEKVIEPLIATLKDDDEYARRSAADALGEIAFEEAVTPLLAAVEDADETVRRSAAYALKNIYNHIRISTPIED